MQAGLNHKMEMERMRYRSLQLRPTLPMYACAWVWGYGITFPCVSPAASCSLGIEI